MSMPEPPTIDLGTAGAAVLAVVGIVGAAFALNAAIGGLAIFTNYTPIGRLITRKKGLLPKF